MATNEELQHASFIYDLICKTLDNKNWTYEKDEENFGIKTAVQGEDLPMPIIMQVSPEKKVVTIGSYLPFDIPERARVAIAIATCMANDTMALGHFDFDISRGCSYFTIATCYLDSVLSTELFDRLIDILCCMVDKYNDRFLMITKMKEVNVKKIAEILFADDEDDE